MFGRGTNSGLVDFEDLIRGVLVHYDPAAKLTQAEGPEDMYHLEARQILRELRLVVPRSFLAVRGIVAGYVSSPGVPVRLWEPTGEDRVWEAAEEIWQAWAHYELHD
jgi:hypothetical protein